MFHFAFGLGNYRFDAVFVDCFMRFASQSPAESSCGDDYQLALRSDASGGLVLVLR
jgi:hypothetical protein